MRNEIEESRNCLEVQPERSTHVAIQAARLGCFEVDELRAVLISEQQQLAYLAQRLPELTICQEPAEEQLLDAAEHTNSEGRVEEADLESAREKALDYFQGSEDLLRNWESEVGPYAETMGLETFRKYLKVRGGQFWGPVKDLTDEEFLAYYQYLRGGR
ncbi:MAG TPA: hypothetical protein V6D08_20205 [Candidatus Obscuribacterales bacterium]